MNSILDNRQTFARPFLLTITLSLVGIFVWWLFETAMLGVGSPQTVEQVLLVALLVIIQLLGHWYSPHISPKMLFPYILVQNALVILTTIFSKNAAPFSSVLHLALICEMFGFFESAGWGIFAYLLYLIGTLLSFPLVFGPNYPFSWAIWSFILLALTAGPFYGALFLLVRARRQAQTLFKELDIAHRQLAFYAEQVEQLTLSAERARMARELHDTLAQGMAGMSLQLEALEASLEQRNIEKAQEIVTQVKNRARAALRDSRKAIADLRIMPERPDALADAIREEVDRFSVATGISCTLDLPSFLTLQTSMMEHTLRCITESLSNVARHAQAHRVSIKLNVTDNELTLQIHDDGIGFDPRQVPASGHYGLLGLRERARLMGATLNIESKPGNGTDVLLKAAIRA